MQIYPTCPTLSPQSIGMTLIDRVGQCFSQPHPVPTIPTLKGHRSVNIQDAFKITDEKESVMKKPPGKGRLILILLLIS